MDEILERMLVKPLPKKYTEESKHVFSLVEQAPEEPLVDSKIVDSTKNFSKSQYNDFIAKISPSAQFIDKTKELEKISQIEASDKKLEGFDEFKNQNTITKISLKQPLEEIIILQKIEKQTQDTKDKQYTKDKEDKEDKKDTEYTEEATEYKKYDSLEADEAKSKTVKAKDYFIDSDFVVDNEMLIGDTKIKSRIINTKKPMIKTDSYYLENREIYIKYIQQLFEPYYQKLLQEERDIKSGKITVDCNNYKDNSFKLFTHQELITRYINLYTPYRGLLLYHGLGSGKTCSSIAIAEGLKDEMKIMVFMPASLKQNYIDELKKCGDFLYKKNQYWEFVNVNNNEKYIKTLSVLLHLSEDFIRKNKGAWMVNASKESNYDNLTPSEQTLLNDQIDRMIKYKYSFISYNAPNFKTTIEQITSVDLNDPNNNPFNDKVIIIDEAHNFISRIVNKLNSQKNSSYIVNIYKKLMDAENCKIILLTGTPIINFPNEVAVAFNILRGYIKTLEINFTSVKSNFSLEYFKSILGIKNISENIDIIEYNNKTNVLKIIKNPFGFINNETNKVIYSSDNKFSTLDFFTNIIDIFKEKKLNFTHKIINNLVLPDGFKEFKEMFIDSNDKIINEMLFKRRIIGLTSYFRSAQEQLMPTYNEDEDLEIVNIEMSDFQFKIYAEARIKEMTAEKNKIKQLKQKKQNDDKLYSENVSTYRLFSRMYCNFVFPDSIKRPIPSKDGTIETTLNSVTDKETLDETVIDNMTIDEKIEASEYKLEKSDSPEIEKEISETKPLNYNELLLKTYKKLDVEGSTHLRNESLAKLSPKFTNILRILNNDTDFMGIHLLYSQFKTLEGIGIFKLVLKHNNYAEIKIKKNSSGIYELNMDEKDYNKPFFACYSGDETYEEKIIIKDILNNNYSMENPPLVVKQLRQIKGGQLNNNFGQFIKLLMITSSGAEGISLKNVRYVHIMEPYWHPVRMKQVIGRARRICSHNELEKEYQNIKVFCYIMVFNEQIIDSINKGNFKELKKDTGLINNKQLITSDQYLYEVSYKKQKITESILTNIKESSIDCSIYPNGNEKLSCLRLGSNTSKVDYDTLSYMDDIKQQKLLQNEKAIPLNTKSVGEKYKTIKKTKDLTLINKVGTNEVYYAQTDEEKRQQLKPRFYGIIEKQIINGVEKSVIKKQDKL